MPPRAASSRDVAKKTDQILVQPAKQGGPSFLDRMSPFEVSNVYGYGMRRRRRAAVGSAGRA